MPETLSLTITIPAFDAANNAEYRQAHFDVLYTAIEEARLKLGLFEDDNLRERFEEAIADCCEYAEARIPDTPDGHEEDCDCRECRERRREEARERRADWHLAERGSKHLTVEDILTY